MSLSFIICTMPNGVCCIVHFIVIDSVCADRANKTEVCTKEWTNTYSQGLAWYRRYFVLDRIKYLDLSSEKGFYFYSKMNKPIKLVLIPFVANTAGSEIFASSQAQ